jgi:hypothetical protein
VNLWSYTVLHTTASCQERAGGGTFDTERAYGRAFVIRAVDDDFKHAIAIQVEDAKDTVVIWRGEITRLRNIVALELDERWCAIDGLLHRDNRVITRRCIGDVL